jgi:hypothetical protein
MSGKKQGSFTGFNTLFGWAKYNSDGTISFGGIDKRKEKHAVMLLNNYDPAHRIVMGSSGANRSRTYLGAPKGITMKCGNKNSRDDGTFIIQVENGNMIIDVQNGDFGVKARNINMRAEYGPTNKEGNVTLYANQKVRVEGTIVEVFGKQKVDITCNKLLKLMGDTEIQMISGICNMTSYSSRRGKKGDMQSDIIPGDMKKKEQPPVVGGSGSAGSPTTDFAAAADATTAQISQQLADRGVSRPEGFN